MVMIKLWASRLTETLDLEFLGRAMLFPRVQNSLPIPPTQSDHQLWSEECEVTEGELDQAEQRLATRNSSSIPRAGWLLIVCLEGHGGGFVKTSHLT